MIPSTPTPYPAGSPPIEMPEFGLWNMTDNAVQTWNSFNSVVVGFQALVLLGIIIGILMMLYHYASKISVDRND